ncbi:patatin-like phospholipase family protein [Lysobacter silvisoli]|nr:patatin-like phospholipase family protein [Lysobacter silvisoli]
MKITKLRLLTLAGGIALGSTLMSFASSAQRSATPVQARPLPLARAERAHPGDDRRPVIGLALGGGGMRGLAHIGVLQALEEAGIEPDLIVGTSAGALVGAIYASGKDAQEIARLAQQVEIGSFVDFTLSTQGLMRGDRIADWVDTTVGAQPIDAFPIRFAAVATDLQQGRPMLLDRGDAGEAVRASAAVPGVTLPVPYAQGHLVDGGVASLVPVRAAKALGADVVIAVDIYCRSSEAAGLSAPSVLRQTMHRQSCLIAEPELAEADIRIAPEVIAPGISDRPAQQRAIDAGYEAARKALAEGRQRDIALR